MLEDYICSSIKNREDKITHSSSSLMYHTSWSVNIVIDHSEITHQKGTAFSESFISYHRQNFASEFFCYCFFWLFCAFLNFVHVCFCFDFRNLLPLSYVVCMVVCHCCLFVFKFLLILFLNLLLLHVWQFWLSCCLIIKHIWFFIFCSEVLLISIFCS